jgi:hypothetical protein
MISKRKFKNLCRGGKYGVVFATSPLICEDFFSRAENVALKAMGTTREPG